jgi:translation elongation factor EF-G
MSEHLPHHGESGEKHEPLSEHELHQSHERQRKIHEAAAEQAKQAEKSPEELEQIRSYAEHEAKSAEEMLQEASRESQDQENEPTFITHELKEIAYQRLLKRARRHLPTYSRAMSKVIHQPIVDTLSEATAKTVGRPSGIIGGGLLALVGTSIYYYLAKHFGYSYNSFVFLLLMVVGFVLGWSIEVTLKMLKAITRK